MALRGRKSRYHELRVVELGEMSINWAIDNFKTFSKNDKMKILLALSGKFVPTKIESEIEVKHVLADRLQRATERVMQLYGSRN